MTLGPLIIRVIAGLTMAAHGGQKLFGWFVTITFGRHHEQLPGHPVR